MLERYRDTELCKKDISDFIELVERDIGCIHKEKMRCIAKGIILIKT